jgi:hypothetical protein
MKTKKKYCQDYFCDESPEVICVDAVGRKLYLCYKHAASYKRGGYKPFKSIKALRDIHKTGKGKDTK